MIGTVDEAHRALMPISLRASANQTLLSTVAWIDTAFIGSLVIPRKEIARLGLLPTSTTEAVLADGTIIELETYTCSLDWFGATYRVQAIASDGERSLLGTTLLAGHRLVIDYSTQTVELT